MVLEFQKDSWSLCQPENYHHVLGGGWGGVREATGFSEASGRERETSFESLSIGFAELSIVGRFI